MRFFRHYLTIIRYFFITLLFASALGKLLDMNGFYGVVASYQLLPQAIIGLSAWLLVGVEFGLSVWLMTQRRLPQATIILVALHVIYFAWLTVALLRGLDIANCGCFGVYFARPLTWFTLIEDAMLIALAAILWRGVSANITATPSA
jgi:Methylamine utilisation protein MauE